MPSTRAFLATTPSRYGVHDRGDVDGQIWISMDFVDGTDAGELLRRYPKGMPRDEVLNIVTSVGEALDYAHAQGLLHRDVKPANIMLTDSAAGRQRILLGDFGIARRVDDNSNLTATNMTVGTVFYAAPEQLMGEELDGRADQYALAATAFHLLTGSPPFHHSNPTVVISQHLTASPPAIGDRRPELSALDPVLSKALSKDPKDRFVTCTDFARALAHRLGVEPDADVDRTEASAPIATPAHAGGRHEAERSAAQSYLRPAYIVPGVLAVLLLVAIALVLIQFREIEKLMNDSYTPSPKPAESAPRASSPGSPSQPTTTVTASASATPSAPVVGANCAPVGASATTANGNTIYCSTLQSTGASIWSVNQGVVPPPTVTVTTEATDEPLPIEEETPVRVCMQETGKTRRECREAIRASNGGG